MAKRESAAERSQPKRRSNGRVTDEFIEAGKKNLAKGRKKREELAQESSGVPAGERWASLLDGTLTVQDLDDSEVAKMQVKSRDGSFAGKKRAIPSHLAHEFHKEAIRRANDKFRTAAPEAVQALLDIGRDPDVKESDRVRALMYVIDRALGKTPETIRVEGASPFDALLGDAVGINREVPDDAREAAD